MFNITMGFAQTDITPDQPLQLVGYDVRPDNLSRGVLHRLLAQTLVWQSSKQICCLIAVDSLGFTTSLSNQLRQQVAAILQTTPAAVMLCFSHTHAAPNAAAEKSYYRFVCAQILQAVQQAQQTMTPIQAAWGLATNTIGVNRRAASLHFDDRLGILKITGPKPSSLKVLLLRITAHANVLTADNYAISADYFGAVRQRLTQRYGCPVVIIQGAAGDVKPKFRQANADFLETHPSAAAQTPLSASQQKLYFKQSLQALETIAQLVEQAVAEVLPTLLPQPVQTLTMFSRRASFYADVPSWTKAQALANEAWTSAAIDGTGWLQEVKRLLAQHITQQKADTEIQYLMLNEGCLCGTPYEAMSAIATAIWQSAANPLLFFNGYTNGCESYLPTAAEYDQGGYEVLWSNLLYYPYHGRVMPLNRDSADRLVREVVQGYLAFHRQ